MALLEKIRTAHTIMSSHPDYSGGEFRFTESASPEEVAAVAEAVQRELPRDLVQLFTTECATLVFEWGLEDEEGEFFELAGQEMYFGSGEILSLENLPRLLNSHAKWCSDLPDWEPHFPVMGLANGDMLAVDMRTPAQNLVYLSHESEPGECVTDVFPFGYATFLDQWSALLCPGPEGWILDCFFAADKSLPIDSPNAKRWLNYAIHHTR